MPGGERVAQLAASTPTIVLQSLMLVVALGLLRSSQREAQRRRKATRRRRAVALAADIDERRS